MQRAVSNREYAGWRRAVRAEGRANPHPPARSLQGARFLPQDDGDSERLSRDPLGDTDRAYRHAYGGSMGTPFGTPLRSAYATIIGDSPDCGPGDRDKAKTYLIGIEAAIEQGGWSSAERTRLYRLRDKWKARAEGRDPRFEVAGTRPGRLEAGTESVVRAVRKRQAKPKRARYVRYRRTDFDWSEFEGDMPLPRGKAKGAPSEDDLGGDSGDEETGEKFRSYSDRDYLIPGSDKQGHSMRLQCRCMPAHFRWLTAIYQSGKFPFRTFGDSVRWCVDFGIRELAERMNDPKMQSVSRQVDVIREILLDEQYHLDYSQTFEGLVDTVNRHQAAQAVGEARRVVALVKNQIDGMPDGYWKGRYLEELKRRCGHLLEGEGVDLGNL